MDTHELVDTDGHYISTDTQSSVDWLSIEMLIECRPNVD